MSGDRGWLDARLPPVRFGPAGWVRLCVRGGLLALVVYGGLALHLIVGAAERIATGGKRPLTPWITQGVCRAALWLLGLRLAVTGQPMRGVGAMVANHASWLDIFTLNAVVRVTFVAKSEVAGWAGIGWLARATGTIFIARKGAEAPAQARLLTERMAAGHRLLFFPEGTSSDGLRVLPFKSTLFAAFMVPELRETAFAQPVTVAYEGPSGQDARIYGWWGDMAFAPHLSMLLSAPGRGVARVVLHSPLRVADFADRKALSAACEAAVRSGHPGG